MPDPHTHASVFLPCLERPEHVTQGDIMRRNSVTLSKIGGGNLELDLAKVVAKFESIVELCVRDVTPHPMCAYALELATVFNGYYNHKDENGKRIQAFFAPLKVYEKPV